MKIILASASPRRRELLKKLGCEFDVRPSNVDEDTAPCSPPELVSLLARKKAMSVAACIQKEENEGGGSCKYLIIGADTVVAKDREILGKPSSKKDAARMLMMLEGSTHTVYTGVCLIRIGKGIEHTRIFCEETEVEFYPMSADEIERYIDSGEPIDKAGAYGIQGLGAVFIRSIKGDYSNVIGLPIAALYHEIKDDIIFENNLKTK